MTTTPITKIQPPERSALPWTIGEPSGYWQHAYILDANGELVTEGLLPHDAATIVRAVNRDHLWDEMVALVREVVEGRNTNTQAMRKASPSWVKDARALLAKVKP